MRFFVLTCIVLLIAFAPKGTVLAQTDSCAPPNYRLDVRPGPSDRPTEVEFGIRVADITEINDVNQTISIDMVSRMRWTDPRLADLAGCRLSIHDIWFPNLILRNSGRMFARWPETASVDKGGQVTYLQRNSGTFASYHSLADFPFDTQQITLQLLQRDWSSEKVRFSLDETFTGQLPVFNISDWVITGVDAKIAEQEIQAFGQTLSTFLLTVNAHRYLSYYVWKIMVPVALIVFMSWCVFWIHPTQFGTQLGLSGTSVLTMVAFVFATTNIVPRLGYFTMLDKYIAGATIFVFVALLQSLTTGYLASREFVTLAKRIDRVSRVVFPLAFFVLCYLFFDQVR